MSPRANWRDNQERARWEAVIGPFHAVARLDASTGRSMAYLEDNQTRGTNHMVRRLDDELDGVV